MKTLIILLLGFTAYGQTTAIPDPAFEARLIALGHDSALDGVVLTSNISSLNSLLVSGSSITDLTGIQDFVSLVSLGCGSNQLTTIDITQNVLLSYFYCNSNDLTSLDISQNLNLIELSCGSNLLTDVDVTPHVNLTEFHCANNLLTSINVTQNPMLYDFTAYNNQITSIDVSQNPDLTIFSCNENLLTELDLSGNPLLWVFNCNLNMLSELNLSQNQALVSFSCANNQLSCLNVKNGNNWNSTIFNATSNPNLSCIEVDDVTWSNVNWPDIDPASSFSLDCNNSCSWEVGTEELSNAPKQLIKIIDLMGRETNNKPNTPLIYIYSDGSRERVFKVEK